MDKQFTQIREGLHIDFNVPIKAKDGLILRANVYRPIEEGKYGVILTYGPYAKDLFFSDVYSTAWDGMLRDCPEIGIGSSNIHQTWEVVDPEKWCPRGYVCVRVDSRGSGWSPGVMDCYSAQENSDFYDCIEWAGVQPWSNGKVGINGISYYAVNAWMVAQLQPPHLAAICTWEGFTNWYRGLMRHGGILNEMQYVWMLKQGASVQYGKGVNGFFSKVHGKPVGGDVTMTEKELLENRVDTYREAITREMDDEWWQSHTVTDYSKIQVPLLSAGNWGGQVIHLKGNMDGFMHAGSEQKWLEVHGKEHWTPFYAQWGMDLQMEFFDYFLLGKQNGWDKRGKVELKVRHVGEEFVSRWENEWPLARTKYTKLYFDPDTQMLCDKPTGKKGTITYRGISDEGVTFMTPMFKEEVEITGHSLAKLVASSSTVDADIFLVLRLYKPDMEEVTFIGANDAHTPLAYGWLRASHRKLDEAKSTEFEPWHTHDEKQPLVPGEPVDLTVEIWPTCIVIPKGYRLALTIRGKDYVCEAAKENKLIPSNNIVPCKGLGPCTHGNNEDRPPEIFDGEVTLHFSDETYLQVPVIPEK